MFRDRTNLYLSYRRTIPRGNDATLHSRFDTLMEEEEGLIGHRKSPKPTTKPKGSNEDIELKSMAPSIFDISNELDGTLVIIKNKTAELGALYKKLLITSHTEKAKLERQLEDLNYELTKKFEACYVLIKKFEFLQKNYQRLKLNYNQNEILILENFKKNYALKIQEKSLIFRNLQNNYIKFLRDEDDLGEADTLLSANTSSYNLLEEEELSKNIEAYSREVLKQTQLQSNDNVLQTREREISKIAMGILEISTIFKEMDSLIVDQGSVLDRIDYNISRTVEDLKNSDKELNKAQGYQKRTTRCKIILLLALLVFVMVVLILITAGHSLSKPAPTAKPEQRPSIENGDSQTQDETNDQTTDNNSLELK